MKKRLQFSVMAMLIISSTHGSALAAPPAGVAPLTSVNHDATLTGAGTTSSPLSVVAPYTGVVHDGSLVGAGTAASPLKVAPTGVAPASVGAQVGPSVSVTTTANSWVPIPFTAADAQYDTSSFIGTDKFIVPTAAIYIVTIHGSATNSSPVEDRIDLAYRINGGTLVGLFHQVIAAGKNVHANSSFQKMLQAGDQVEILVLTAPNSYVVDQIEIGIGRL